MILNQAALEKAVEAYANEVIECCFGTERESVDAGTSIVRRSFTAGLEAYLTELSKTHAIVPRELDSKLLEAVATGIECCEKQYVSEELAKAAYSALISELDAREKGDG